LEILNKFFYQLFFYLTTAVCGKIWKKYNNINISGIMGNYKSADGRVMIML